MVKKNTLSREFDGANRVNSVGFAEIGENEIKAVFVSIILQQFSFKIATNKNIKPFAGLRPAPLFWDAFDR